jgi:hypothetical protein
VHPSAELAKEALLHIIRRTPAAFDLPRTRWRLQDLIAVCDWLTLTTESSLSHLLSRLHLSYQRGRDWVHSPDPDYEAKRQHLNRLDQQVRAAGGQQVLLYLDEFTYYRQPTLSFAFAPTGEQPLAVRSHRSNTPTRLLGALDALTARVHALQASRIGVAQLVALYQQLTRAYPEAERLYVVQDNWPVHYHPDVLVALEPQQSPFPLRGCPSWGVEPSARAKRRWGALNLPIQLVPLPTYASWLNPIEKLWRWLKQDLLHLHPFADDLAGLRQRVAAFLEQFAQGSPELLRYVGLVKPP